MYDHEDIACTSGRTLLSHFDSRRLDIPSVFLFFSASLSQCSDNTV